VKTILRILIATSLLCAYNLYADYRPIVLDPSYEHDRWGTSPQDHIFKFAAYTTSFDGMDYNNRDTDGNA